MPRWCLGYKRDVNKHVIPFTGSLHCSRFVLTTVYIFSKSRLPYVALFVGIVFSNVERR